MLVEGSLPVYPMGTEDPFLPLFFPSVCLALRPPVCVAYREVTSQQCTSHRGHPVTRGQTQARNLCPVWEREQPAQLEAPQYSWGPLPLGRGSLVPMGWPQRCFSPPQGFWAEDCGFPKTSPCCVRGLHHWVTQQGPATLLTIQGGVGSSLPSAPPWTSPRVGGSWVSL